MGKIHLIVFILAAFMLLMPLLAASQAKPAQVTPLPQLVGMKAADAQKMLTQQGWKVQTETRPVTDPSKAGSVVQQVPPQGTKVLQSQQPVTPLVGQYQSQATVPNVVGMPLARAHQTMVSAALNAVVTMENVADPGKNNVVLKQEVTAGKPLSKGSGVPIVVGKHTAPVSVPVPNAVGMPAGHG